MRYDVLPAPEDGAWEPVAAEAARRLAGGQVLVHPTSTLYGLGTAEGSAGDRELARLKGRAPTRPFLRLASDAGAVRARPGVVWDERAERLAREFWPGALTLVLEDGSEWGLAVRVDAHPFPRMLLRLHGGPMSSTSVNRSGEAPAGSPEEVRRTLERMPESAHGAVLVDAGPLPGAVPSTLLSLRVTPARVLREGAVPTARLRDVLGGAIATGADA